jgi:outer membrane protein TolC
VVAETALTYIDLDRSRRSLEYLRSQTANLESVAQITADRVASGLEPSLDTTRADLSTARSRSQLATIESQISLLDFRLKDLTGIPQSENIVTEEVQAPELPADATLDTLVAGAINNYPGIKQLDDEVRSKEFAVASQEGSRWPRINLVGNYGLFSKINNYDQYFQKFARNNLTIGLSIVVPLYQRERFNAQIAQAQAELAQARFRREETRAAVSRQVREAWGAVQQQAAAREVSRLELEVARKSLDAVLAQYDEGKVNRLAVEQARVEENRAWVSLLDADFQNEKSRLELLRLTGEIRAALP